MELTLQVSDQVARKIKALAILSCQSAEQITKLFETRIEDVLNNALAHELGLGSTIQVATSGYCAPAEAPVRIMDAHAWEKHNPTPARPSEPESDAPTVFTSEDDEVMPFGIAESTETETEEHDTVLDEETQQNFKKLGGAMALKDRLGKETKYEDPFMADIQSMVEDDDLGLDDTIAAAAASDSDEDIAADDFDRPAKKSGQLSLPSDVSDGELDVLPMDYGLDSVTANHKSGADFFLNALAGKSGDKSARNKVKRKRIME